MIFFSILDGLEFVCFILFSQVIPSPLKTAILCKSDPVRVLTIVEITVITLINLGGGSYRWYLPVPFGLACKSMKIGCNALAV